MFKVWALGYTARSKDLLARSMKYYTARCEEPCLPPEAGRNMPKLTLLIIALAVIIITSLATLYLNSGGPKSTPRSEIDTAVNQAKFLYSQRKKADGDFSKGPCLSNALMFGWVADIAHNPRLPIDDLPENQCPAYLEGRAQHFVELDPDGNLIRAQ